MQDQNTEETVDWNKSVDECDEESAGSSQAENRALFLVSQIKSGDQDAFRQLTEQYKQLVDSMVKRFAPSVGLSDGDTNVNGFGVEELRQDGYVALYKAAMSYDPEGEHKGKAVRFGLYAKICIRNAFVSEVRRYKRVRKQLGKKTQEETKRRGWSELFSEPDLDGNAALLFKQVCDPLSPFEKEVFVRYIQGKPPRVIAAELSRTEKSVSNAVYRIKSKNKGLLEKSL